MTDWTAQWQPAIDAVGTDFGDGSTRWGADPVEAGAIRRYVEVLEFDCALHLDAAAARGYGFGNIIAPYTSALTWSIPPMWQPGDAPLFVDDDRDAQPARTPIDNSDFTLGPRTTGFFATDMEFEFVRPLVVGERIGKRGRRLLSCVPKQTAVGRGAFLVWESELVDTRGDVVVRMRTGTYAYVPLAAKDAG
jgi:hypothetical protein